MHFSYQKNISKFISTLLIIWLTISVINISCQDHDDDSSHDAHEDSSHHRPDDPDLSTSHDHYDKEGHHDSDFDHDVVTGSHHETEEFKDLEPEEAKKRLAILFDKMDLDKDGSVNKAELLQWIIQSFKNLDRENAQQKLEEYDENRDKKLSLDEYLVKTYGHSEKEILDMQKTNSSDMKSFLDGIHLDKLKFELADANKDGFLDIEEYTRFLHPQNYPEMAPYELSRTLDDFDKNKDGAIDLPEFLGDDKLDKETEKHERASFKEYDVDNNGVLDKNEVVAWAMPGFDKTAQSEVEHLFTESDMDKNKLLGRQEVIDHHDLWVGSHATDFGKHLDDMKPHQEL